MNILLLLGIIIFIYWIAGIWYVSNKEDWT